MDNPPSRIDFIEATLTIYYNEISTQLCLSSKGKLMQAIRLYILLLLSFFFSTTVSAQVFNSGPSDSALFTSLINLPGDALPDSVRDTQFGNAITDVGGPAGETIQVNIAEGGDTGSFLEVGEGVEVNLTGGILGFAATAARGSEVNISSGLVDGGFTALSGSEVNITGGTLGFGFSARPDTVVNISGGFLEATVSAFGVVNMSGGTVGSNFDAESGSVVNISGGSAGFAFQACVDSEVNISGGSVGDSFVASFRSVVNISGGSFGEGFTAQNGSSINLFGSEFFLDGVPMDSLAAGEAVTIVERDVTLSGVFTDGSPFSFDLDQDFIPRETEFLPSATLTVTLTSELLLGDANQDGFVNFSDIAPFIASLLSVEFLAQADVNEDGVINFLDITPFITLLSL